MIVRRPTNKGAHVGVKVTKHESFDRQMKLILESHDKDEEVN